VSAGHAELSAADETMHAMSSRLVADHPAHVTTARALGADGVSRGQRATQLRAGRWQRCGLAIVAHNGPLSADQRRQVALVHAGPQSLLTAFTAAEVLGLAGWERPEVHVLAPIGTRQRAGSPVPLVLHRNRTPARREAGLRIEHLPDALVRAAASLDRPRSACGLLAAAVQQRRTTPEALKDALDHATRARHRSILRAAVADIAGSDALSEIDFVRLCRRHGLPAPEQQTMRRDACGRRRYLDATWRRKDGRLVVVEIDGALHLVATRWWDDQLRQNELALAEALVLRFPSVVIRTEGARVAEQIRRALRLPRP
jgi:hypothetical protein